MRMARTVVTVPDLIETNISRESRVLVLRVMVEDDARERVTTRERAMSISATELQITQTL